MENKAILTAEEEQKLIQPIDEYVGKIQEKINGLRADGTDQIISLNNHMAVVRENANYSKAEKAAIIAEDKKALLAAKAVEQQNKPEVKKLIDDAVKYLTIIMIRNITRKSPFPARSRRPQRRSVMKKNCRN